MFIALITSLLAPAEGESAPWWNIPSFEAWRWLNLLIFVVVFIYILRRPVSQAMRARREGIRRDLMRAQEERKRIRQSTEEETRKLREQAQREIESAGKAARQELREFAAEQSVRLAEEMIRRDIKPEDDARLVSLRVEELGGVRH